ncbi:maleylpyruvate isomerase family mycothiol-dependent enzyme [Actinomadura sp. HBU206391]|uniref:maleylpyruvate isomerase family mycothiol-dependent enzyme n=1 Tax=Actinomadura sp. HBU206391 TaxID=2731692 RepID=UPI00164F7CAD|nr:maleylpyruvate isomerase family mycothiol-dependent enzyme [Actinomadura sp. HBU206391]MBC6459157.1 maleylpyruvate isomerase family mycothiol-dependent enzyme [Actinomadura sp. HBU206391]
MRVYEIIANERRALADLFDELTPEQAREQSLCAGWTVHDVAAHLVMPLETGRPALALALLTARGDFDRANRRLTARHAARPLTELAGSLRRNAEHPFKLPGMGPEAPLTDLLVHGQDIRRPLGLDREFSEERITLSLRFLTETKARGFVPRGRLDGLAFETTDLDWSHGEGALVRGPAEALLLTICGRPAGLDDLHGDGVTALRSRLTESRSG